VTRERLFAPRCHAAGEIFVFSQIRGTRPFGLGITTTASYTIAAILDRPPTMTSLYPLSSS
jgi:hypothetical protein